MGILYVLITAILFTTYEPVTKLFAADINPFAITAIRFIIGALVLLPFSIMEMKKKYGILFLPSNTIKVTSKSVAL